MQICAWFTCYVRQRQQDSGANTVGLIWEELECVEAKDAGTAWREERMDI